MWENSGGEGLGGFWFEFKLLKLFGHFGIICRSDFSNIKIATSNPNLMTRNVVYKDVFKARA